MDTAGLFLHSIAMAFEQSADMHILIAPDGIVEYVNPEFETVTGFSRDEAVGNLPVIFERSLCPDDFYSALWDMLKTGKVFKGGLACRKRNGGIFCGDMTISPLRDDAGKIAHFLVTGRDVTRSMREREQLQCMANFDSLTGLPNRNLFMDRLQQALVQSFRERQQLALVYLDLDDFKLVNDHYGHARGDEFLQGVAFRLKNCIRQGDTVARLGGDEFVMILANVDGAGSVRTILKKIILALKRYSLPEDSNMTASCSIGVSLYPRDGTDAGELLRCADIAMYCAKGEGRGGYSFFGTGEVSGIRRQAVPEKSEYFPMRLASIPVCGTG